MDKKEHLVAAHFEPAYINALHEVIKVLEDKSLSMLDINNELEALDKALGFTDLIRRGNTTQFWEWFNSWLLLYPDYVGKTSHPMASEAAFLDLLTYLYKSQSPEALYYIRLGLVPARNSVIRMKGNIPNFSKADVIPPSDGKGQVKVLEDENISNPGPVYMLNEEAIKTVSQIPGPSFIVPDFVGNTPLNEKYISILNKHKFLGRDNWTWMGYKHAEVQSLVNSDVLKIGFEPFMLRTLSVQVLPLIAEHLEIQAFWNSMPSHQGSDMWSATGYLNATSYLGRNNWLYEKKYTHGEIRSMGKSSDNGDPISPDVQIPREAALGLVDFLIRLQINEVE